ncbi:MAG: hypothetical protein ACRDQ0_06530, partial [Pseudonocardia sp.]
MHSDAEGNSLDVVIGLSFADVRGLVAWEESSERNEWLEVGAGLTEGSPTALSIESLDGRLWASRAQVPVTVPRWLSGVIVWLGLFPPALLLNLVLDPYLAGWPTWLRTLFATLVLVP